MQGAAKSRRPKHTKTGIASRLWIAHQPARMQALLQSATLATTRRLPKTPAQRQSGSTQQTLVEQAVHQKVQRPQTDGIANWQGQTKVQQPQPQPLPAALGRKPGMEQHAPPVPSLGQLGESASAKLRKPVMLSFATQVTK